MDPVVTRVPTVSGSPSPGGASVGATPTQEWIIQTLLRAGLLSALFVSPGCRAPRPPGKAQDASARSYVDTSLARFVRKDTASDVTPAFDKACAVELFHPNFQQITALKKRLGDGAFTALDDAGWYSDAARQLLEEHGTPVFLPLAENVRFEGEQTWTFAIQSLRDQSAYLLFHPRRGLKLIPAADINKGTLDTFFAP